MALQQLGLAITIYKQGLQADPKNPTLLRDIGELLCACSVLVEHEPRCRHDGDCNTCGLWMEKAAEQMNKKPETGNLKPE